ncbi:flagellar biosynthesis regulator FlaF [Sphingomonas suaedae]|uniref:Flagellar biosynthesis regulator FlaF n=1 Tax=Sphingomonas suaedae TaxID=2599297 RepID=A0A518RE98_9SPHN|nr:flagellar biosynthesis regulator FlaF [Sphingomonas suaedae]QDX25773.1 flagellar biosynthesis regulator FlaF [Sphingomonas suaedae]
MSLSAYQRARTLVETPRATEQRLIRDVTAALIEARDMGYSGGRLMNALHWNREMWDAFANACGAPGNSLPDELRASIISIGLWVNRHASDVMKGRESIDPLIEVNRSLLEGLAEGRMAA